MQPRSAPVAEQGTAHQSAPSPPPRSAPELDLLRSWPSDKRSNGWRYVIGGSAALHILLFWFAIHLPAFVSRDFDSRLITRKVTPLYVPPDILTQKMPNREKLSKSFDLSSLLPPQSQQRRVVAPPPGSIRKLELPSTKPTPLARSAPKITAEAPNLNLSDNPLPAPQGASNGIFAAAPPPPVPVTVPFETRGGQQAADTNRILPPKTSIQDAIKSLSHQSNGTHLEISDEGIDKVLPVAPGRTGAAGQMHSAVELQSDPQGADFRPYLAQVLAIVRRNWFRVLPESARMGVLRGRTIIQFQIDRDGSIPKLVVSDPSGSTPLDRAAIAGLSMSNPLPPLPRDFKGFQIKLQFSFNYNVPSL